MPNDPPYGAASTDGTTVQQPSTVGDTITTETMPTGSVHVGQKMPRGKIAVGGVDLDDGNAEEDNPLPVGGEFDRKLDRVIELLEEISMKLG